MKTKKYLPVTYVDEDGVIWTREQLTNKIYKSYGTEVQIDISTPNGSGNPFHQKALSGTIPKFTYHWTSDPRKNKEWRDKKIKEVGEIIFAQEYDIDYDASLPNIVIPNKYLRECVNIDVDTSGMIIAGLDVADDGEDKNAIVIRQGGKDMFPKTMK